MAKIEQKVMDEQMPKGWFDEVLTLSDGRALFDLPPSGKTPS